MIDAPIIDSNNFSVYYTINHRRVQEIFVYVQQRKKNNMSVKPINFFSFSRTSNLNSKLC